jgi:hypothetical protein
MKESCMIYFYFFLWSFADIQTRDKDKYPLNSFSSHFTNAARFTVVLCIDLFKILKART